jgi:trk system potassium uptake protein TrkA
MDLKIAVLGAGTFGLSLSKSLVELGADVILIDRDRDQAELARDFATEIMIFDSTDEIRLRESGINQVDVAIVCVGDSLEDSVLIVTHLRNMGIKRIIARATHSIHRKIFKLLGATETISPAEEMGRNLAHSLIHMRKTSVVPYDLNYSLARFRVPSQWIGKRVGDIEWMEEYAFRLVTVMTSEESEENPSKCLGIDLADIVLESKHEIAVFALGESLRSFFKKFQI